MSIEIGTNDYVRHLLTKGKDEPVDTAVDGEKITLPSWYDDKLFKRGQQFYTRNIFAMFIGMLCGLIAVLSVPSILRVLKSTNKSGTSRDAYRRYIRTIYHVVHWHWYVFGGGGRAIADSDAQLAMRNTKIWKSLLAVRKTHFLTSRLSSAAGSGCISQKDMALTQFGFMGFITLKHRLLGLHHTDDTLAATIHFWRVIGHMLGIKDEYNICTDEWQTSKVRLQAIASEVYKPALSQPSNGEFMEMVKPLVNGLWSFNPFLCVDAFLYFTKRLVNCDGYQYLQSDRTAVQSDADAAGCSAAPLYKQMSRWNRFVLSMLVIILQYLYPYRLFKLYFDFQIYLSLFLITYIPFLAYHRFGFKDSYVRLKL